MVCPRKNHTLSLVKSPSSSHYDLYAIGGAGPDKPLIEQYSSKTQTWICLSLE